MDAEGKRPLHKAPYKMDYLSKARSQRKECGRFNRTPFRKAAGGSARFFSAEFDCSSKNP